MKKKLSYIEMRNLFDKTIDSSVFDILSTALHGWKKNEFLECYMDDIAGQMDEETYNIAIEAPTTIQ